MSDNLLAELKTVGEKIGIALDAAERDAGASPVLVAVVRDFATKAAKAQSHADRDSVIELEQAGDSAKVAAEADPGTQAGTRELVLDAHLAICMLKASLGTTA